MELLVLVCFFLSGASGLIFEMVWTRELGLVFGSTSLAISTVLSAYMGGLALGSHLAGRLLPRLREPLLAYALAEAGVGLYALTIPLWLSAYPVLNQLLLRGVAQHFVVLCLLRFLLTALLLLWPTTLMGATLPLLSQHLGQRQPDGQAARAAQDVGALFSLNTAGAVVGTFGAGFVLLPLLGVRATNGLAAGINLSLAALVLLSRWRDRRRQQRIGEFAGSVAEFAGPVGEIAGPVGEFAGSVATAWQRRLAVISYAISGAAAMVYQVLWTRALAIVLGSSVYSFTLILLSFLVGLSGGAALTTRLLPSVRRPVLALGLCHLLTLGLVIVSYLTIDKLPGVFLFFLRGGSFSVDGLIATQFVLAALAVLPATLLMGAVLPLTMRIYTAAAGSVGRDVGTAYALNTLGAIVGSFAAGFVVMPMLGLQRGLLGCAALTGALAAALLLCSERPRLGGALGAAGLCGALVFLALGPRWNLSHFSAGLFRISLANDIIRRQSWPVPKLLYYQDGVSTTVSVEQWQRTLALKNNGKVDASNSDDMATQIMVGLLPLLFHPRALDVPPEVLVIGYGSGVTIGAVTQFPIRRADVVELEPAVVEAGDRFFGPYNHRPSADPRVRVHIEDGRNFLSAGAGARRYDVIVSEPSNPWITGVSSLFTVDYWRLAKSRLNDDGVFCQWAQLYEMSQRNIKTLLRSFAAVFPYTYVFSAEHLSSDVILIASLRPLPLDVAALSRNFDGRDPRLVAELVRGQKAGVEDLLGDLLLTPDELPAFAAGGDLNTDDNARIEFAAPRDLLGYMNHDPYIHRIYGPEWPYGRFEPYLRQIEQLPGAGGSRAEGYAGLSRGLLRHGRREAAVRLLRRARALGGGPLTDEVGALTDLLGVREVYELEVPLTDGAGPMGVDGLRLDPPVGLGAAEAARAAAALLRARQAAGRRQWAHALHALRDWSERWVEDSGPDVKLLLGFLLYKAELGEDAARWLEWAAKQTARQAATGAGAQAERPALAYYLGRALYMDGRPREAVAQMQRYRARWNSAPQISPSAISPPAR